MFVGFELDFVLANSLHADQLPNELIRLIVHKLQVDVGGDNIDDDVAVACVVPAFVLDAIGFDVQAAGDIGQLVEI